MIAGFVHDTQSISPFESSYGKSGRFQTQMFY